VLAMTDIIGGTVLARVYRREMVLIDPDAEMEDDCLIVMQFEGGEPYMAGWRRTGRDANGRFVPADDVRECAILDFGLRYPWRQSSKWIRVLGRVVGKSRRRSVYSDPAA